MASKREASGETAVATGGGKAAAKRTRGESPAREPGAADPGAGPRLATGDLPVVEMGGGAAAGAIVGRLLGGGKGALLGAAFGAAAGTALGMATGGVLRRKDEESGSRREPAFGPAGRSRPGTEAPAAAAQAPRGTAATRTAAPRTGATRTGATATKEPPAGGAKGSADYEAWTKADLYEEAKRRDIPGRSSMGKAELIKALRSR